MTYALVKQMRQDGLTSKKASEKDAADKILQIWEDPSDSRNDYNNFVMGVTEQWYGRRMPNGKKFDATSTLSLYEISLSIDQRIITQAIVNSYLRQSFANFPGEKFFDEYTGISPSDTVYIPLQLSETGFETASTNASGLITPSTVPNEIKFIQATVSPLRRDIYQYQEGFKLTLGDLEWASNRNIPLQDQLTKRVSRDLMMQEQYFAFNYLKPGTNVAPEANGLFNNTAISTSITYTTPNILAPSTTGRSIIDEFVRIRGAIIAATQNVFAAANMPLCVLVSPNILNALTRTYSDLEGKDALSYLTERGFRIGGLPIMPDNKSFFYYKDYENIEISTARMVEAQPQSYDARTTTWYFPFRNVTAGLTVKRYQAIYAVNGLTAN